MDLPRGLPTYQHRVGRTARAGSEGRAVSIVAERDRAFLKQVGSSNLAFIISLCCSPSAALPMTYPHPFLLETCPPPTSPYLAGAQTRRGGGAHAHSPHREH